VQLPIFTASKITPISSILKVLINEIDLIFLSEIKIKKLNQK